MLDIYEDRLRLYVDTEHAWTIQECKEAARQDQEEQERYENYID